MRHWCPTFAAAAKTSTRNCWRIGWVTNLRPSPYARRKRQHGKSRWTLGKKLTHFIDSILGFSVLPIRIISLIGFIVSLLSFAYGASIVISTILGYREVAGFATLVALLTFLLGVVIIILGIIGEYVWRIFDEVTTRPEAVFDEVY
jgi:polyisoprenyl-phosphate glycosyltransferase